MADGERRFLAFADAACLGRTSAVRPRVDTVRRSKVCARVALLAYIAAALARGQGFETPAPSASSANGASAAAAEPGADATRGFWSRFIDPTDRMFDVTAQSEGGSGFIPLMIPFNEPAIGVGLLGALLYFHPEDDAEQSSVANAPPSASFGGLAASDNGSWLAAGGHSATLNDGRVRYLGALGAASFNLDFYGIGGDYELHNPVGFNITGTLLVQQTQSQLGASTFAAGLRYTLLMADVQFDILPDVDPSLAIGDSNDAGLAAFLNYDTRDNIFTPNRGTYARAAATYFSDSIGGDYDYRRLDLTGHKFWELFDGQLVLGLRAEFAGASDGAPFYSLPWVILRGVPAMRYLGQYAATVEIEPRWKIDSRWSVVAFTGAGRASNSIDTLDEAEAAYNYGVGFRYLLTRRHGLAAGIDLAYGPEDSILTFTFGSAWAL